MNIVVIGTTFIDIKGYPEGAFDPAGRNAGRIEYFPGGVGRNIAEDIASLGADATFISLVDGSGTGNDLMKHLEDIGIDTQYVKAAPNGMGIWNAIFDESGDVYANISVRPDLLPICDILAAYGDGIFSDADGILIELDMDENVIHDIYELAEKYGKPVYCAVSNMSIARSRTGYIEKSECLVCNCQEAGVLYGIDTSDMKPEEMIETIADRMRASGLKKMVVTMGAAGAVYAGKLPEVCKAGSAGETSGNLPETCGAGSEEETPASDETASEDKAGDAAAAQPATGICPGLSVKVVDTTGAGDAFFAGTCWGLVGGRSLKEACDIGNASGARVIGTKSNVLQPHDVSYC